MSAVDRIQKFHDDQIKIMVPSTKPPKILSEVGSFRSWLAKHQDEAVPNGSKAKIMVVLEKYNRAAGHMCNIRPAVISLYQDYLALPEGKLVNSKNKARVLTWLANLENGAEEEDGPSQPTTPGATAEAQTERWDVASIENSGRLCLMLDDRVREGVEVSDAEMSERIKRFFDSDEGCSVLVSTELASAAGSVLVVEAFNEAA